MERTVLRSTRVPLYALHGRNNCPSCGASQWFVGRVIAECACCGDTLPINHAVRPTQMARSAGYRRVADAWFAGPARPGAERRRQSSTTLW
ncbi:hypothetical protein [Sphingomonas hankookensis]|uniref:hypothetical protein n=1 Tax=Sphingomonas hankookensis TaxID=563996 RepID=UPI003D303765